jgi:predicted Zn-dependent peptidase
MSKRLSTLAISIVSLILIASLPVQGFEFSEIEKDIQEYTLDNGLKVIVMERHEAPVASFITLADVGGVDDPKGFTGLAHMFEHMAFKGTTTLGTTNLGEERDAMGVEDSIWNELRRERLKGESADSAKLENLETAFSAAIENAYKFVIPNEFSEIVKREGGVGLNAGTSYDQTMYFFSLPSNKAELWFAMESERFYKPVLREMYKERDVVAEERRMRTESSPFGRLIEEFLALAFKAHPYGVPLVGHMSDIQNYTRAAALAYFKKYYVPSNLTVAIVGDVDPKEMFKLADKYWGRIPYSPKPLPVATVEPEQAGERRMIMEDPSQPIYIAGWHIPAVTDKDRPALDALTDYLGQGRTSLLYKNLVKDKKIAMQVQAFAGFPGDKYPGLAIIYAIPTQGHTNAECEEQIFAEVDKMKDILLTEDEMEGIRSRAKSNFINGLVSNVGLAVQLALYQARWGDWRAMFDELDRINAVTPEDVQRVARKYFTVKNRVVVMMNTAEKESGA